MCVCVCVCVCVRVCVIVSLDPETRINQIEYHSGHLYGYTSLIYLSIILDGFFLLKLPVSLMLDGKCITCISRTILYFS